MLPRRGDQKKYTYTHTFCNYFDFYIDLITCNHQTYAFAEEMLIMDAVRFPLRQLHNKNLNNNIVLMGYHHTKE